MSGPTHYELLGVDKDASQADIKSAFRQQALRNHPDQGGNPALFRMIEEAYETLVSPSKRENYDRRFARSGAHFHDEPADRADEPTQTWTSEEWEAAGWDRSWQGDQASSFDDREPPPDASPTYVATGKRWPRPSEMFERLPPFWYRWAILAFLVYVLAGIAYEFDAIPTQDNVGILQLTLTIVLTWVFGPFCLRLAGWVVAFLGLWNAAQNDASAPETAMSLVMAFGLWFLGHWLHAFKKGEPKSVVADSLFGYLPRPAHPTYRFDRTVKHHI